MARVVPQLSTPLQKKRRLAIFPLFFLGLAVGWQAYGVHNDVRQLNRIAQQTATTLANAHQLATKQPGVSTEFGPDQFQAFNVLVERRIGVKLDPSSLKSIDFEFLGAQLIPVRGQPVAQLLFGAADAPISVLIFRNLPGLTPEKLGSAGIDNPLGVETHGNFSVVSFGQHVGQADEEAIGNLIDHSGAKSRSH